MKRHIHTTLAFVVALAGCRSGSFTEVRSGKHAGRQWQVESRSGTSLFAVTNSVDWRIRLGDLPPVPVNAHVIDWGPAYDTAVWNKAVVVWIPGQDAAYSNAPDTPGSLGVSRTMLYVAPSTLSPDQFRDFGAFMRDAWPGITDSVAGTEPRDFPRIIGLVYGDRERSIREYEGRHGGRPYTLRITPDGQVRLATAGSPETEVWSGLSQKVQMPGRRLYLDADSTGSALTPTELPDFRDRSGRRLPDDFVITVRP